MKKVNILCAGLAAAVAASALVAFGAGEGASQKWTKMYVEDSISNALSYVESYVSNAIANSAASLVSEAKTTTSNGVTTVNVGEGKNRIWFSYEEASVDALVATNAMDAASGFGITNGFLFVWNGDGTYINGNGETIITYTNRNCLTWREIDSAVTNGFETFEGNFAVLRTTLQPSVALAVTNGLRVAEAKMSVFDILGSLLLGTALAAEPSSWPKKASDWYTPQDYQKSGEKGILGWINPDTLEEKTYEVTYDDIKNWTVAKLEISESNLSLEMQTAFSALKVALKADQEALDARTEIATLAAKLAGITWKEKEAEVQDTSSNLKASGSVESTPQQITIKAPNLIAKADEKTITKNTSGELGLYFGGFIDSGLGFAIPNIASANGKLYWNYSSEWVDNISLCWNNGKGKNYWTINGWATQDSCQEKLSDMMTSDDTDHVTQRGKHEILCRYGGQNGEIHYLPLGGLIAADETTISLKEKDSAKGKFAIKGAYDSGNKDKALFSTGAGIEWRTTGGGIKIVGTDGKSNWPADDTDTPAQTITFASASDSNVKVTVTGDKTSATVTIGVYYK